MKKLELVFLMNVSLYFKSQETILCFIQVNKKCLLSVTSLHVNPSFFDQKSLEWFLRKFTVDTVDLNYLPIDVIYDNIKLIRNLNLTSTLIQKKLLPQIESIKIDTKVDSNYVHILCNSFEKILSLTCSLDFFKAFASTFVNEKINNRFFPKVIHLINSRQPNTTNLSFLEKIVTTFNCKCVVHTDRQPLLATSLINNIFWRVNTISFGHITTNTLLSNFETTVFFNENVSNEDLNKLTMFVYDFYVTKLTLTSITEQVIEISELPPLEIFDTLTLNNISISNNNKLSAKRVCLNKSKFICDNSIESVESVSIKNSQCFLNDKTRCHDNVNNTEISFPFVNINKLSVNNIESFKLPYLNNLKKLHIKTCSRSKFVLPEKCFSGVTIKNSEHNTFVLNNESGRVIYLKNVVNSEVYIINKTIQPSSVMLTKCKNIQLICEHMKTVVFKKCETILFAHKKNKNESVTQQINTTRSIYTKIENLVICKTGQQISLSNIGVTKNLYLVDMENCEYKENFLDCEKVILFNNKKCNIEIGENHIKNIIVTCCENVNICGAFPVIESIQNINNINCEIIPHIKDQHLLSNVKDEDEDIDISKEQSMMKDELFNIGLVLRNAVYQSLIANFENVKQLKLINFNGCFITPINLHLEKLEIENCSFNQIKYVATNNLLVKNCHKVKLCALEKIIENIEITNSDISLKIDFKNDNYIKASHIFVNNLKMKNSTCFCQNFKVENVFLDFTNYKENDEKCFCLPANNFQVVNLMNNKFTINRINDINEIKFICCENNEITFSMLSKMSIKTEKCNNIKIFVPQFMKLELEDVLSIKVILLNVPPVEKQIAYYSKERRQCEDKVKYAIKNISLIKKIIKKPHLYDDLEIKFYISLINEFTHDYLQKVYGVGFFKNMTYFVAKENTFLDELISIFVNMINQLHVDVTKQIQKGIIDLLIAILHETKNDELMFCALNNILINPSFTKNTISDILLNKIVVSMSNKFSIDTFKTSYFVSLLRKMFELYPKTRDDFTFIIPQLSVLFKYNYYYEEINANIIYFLELFSEFEDKYSLQMLQNDISKLLVQYLKHGDRRVVDMIYLIFSNCAAGNLACCKKVVELGVVDFILENYYNYHYSSNREIIYVILNVCNHIGNSLEMVEIIGKEKAKTIVTFLYEKIQCNGQLQLPSKYIQNVTKKLNVVFQDDEKMIDFINKTTQEFFKYNQTS
ncbi:hypothetical protein EIN_337660 [Entamoeba invadens IP1]|uniref:C-CAP/cofactor C-like domain-containing protein n=1 Tax=Entamoeba invadens IP1 TaxID=370355 RepID=A0A0A1TV38_ENTIV|nr:hypothetical protein EIN_337660 [Entamoeba invadens IP1]ELP84167.1 hypothetical protein EIN_337660 [Entamoeba invadens IP1]|eukprot:XP_004183513.1 hypothetical protein EIN_337660 [Entamoeba invadens IP1]